MTNNKVCNYNKVWLTMITYKWPWKVYNNKNNNDNYEINNNNDNNTANGNNDNNEIKKKL